VLEHRFPTRTVSKKRLEQLRANSKSDDDDLLRTHGRLDIGNTATKFVLDQSLSATTNTVLFIVLLGLIKGQSWGYIEASLYRVSVASWHGFLIIN
jgi:protein Mpv17